MFNQIFLIILRRSGGKHTLRKLRRGKRRAGLRHLIHIRSGKLLGLSGIVNVDNRQLTLRQRRIQRQGDIDLAALVWLDLVALLVKKCDIRTRCVHDLAIQGIRSLGDRVFL